MEQGGERTQTATGFISANRARRSRCRANANLILISATGGIRRWHCLISFHHRPDINHHYDDKSWQSLFIAAWQNCRDVKQAAERIAQFDKQLAAAKEQMKLPPQPVAAISIPPLHTVPISGRRNQHKGRCSGTTRLYAGEVHRVKRQRKAGQTP